VGSFYLDMIRSLPMCCPPPLATPIPKEKGKTPFTVHHHLTLKFKACWGLSWHVRLNN